jgi:hypothetical protein
MFLVVALAPAASMAARAQGTGEPISTIDGREHPELLPEWGPWESAFEQIAHPLSLEGGEAREDQIARLSRYALYIPVDDARICLEVAESVMAQLRAEVYVPISEAMARESADPPPPGWYRAQYTRGHAIVLQGRARLEALLPERSFGAVTRWITKQIVPGLTMELAREDLPADAPLDALPMRRAGGEPAVKACRA